MESNVTLGDIIQFSKYDWRVLDVQNDKMLIVTKNIVTNRAYHSTEISITWEQCDLRNKYLKTEFYNAFNTEEKNQIIAETIVNKDNQRYNTLGGNPTKDNIFLMSLDEVVRYFGDGNSAKYLENNESETQWIDDKNNSSRIAKFGKTAAWVWLRSPGYYDFQAVYINARGRIAVGGDRVNRIGGVRPAVWLKIL